MTPAYLRPLVLTGPPVGGKRLVGRLLTENGPYVSVIDTGDLIRAELRALGENAPPRDAQGDHATLQLQEHGGGYFVDPRLLEYDYPVVVDGPRRKVEIDHLLQRWDAVILYLDAPRELRFAWGKARASERDPATIEEFIKRDLREFGHTDPAGGPTYLHSDPYQRDLRYAQKCAHAVIHNAGTPEDLVEHVRQFLADLRNNVIGPMASQSDAKGYLWEQRHYGGKRPAPQMNRPVSLRASKP